jgi:signal transduction histidine kinase
VRSTGSADLHHGHGSVFAWTHPSPLSLAAIFTVIGALAWLEAFSVRPETVAAFFLLAAMAVLLLEKSKSTLVPETRNEGFDLTRSGDPQHPCVLTPAELAAAIVHEVNQPLSAMTAHGQACLRWFEREAPDIDAARHSVERMLANGTRAAEIIAGLNALARGSAPDRTPVDVNDVLHSTVARLAKSIEAGKISVSLVLGDRLPRVSANRIELEQVMLNLVRNAVQALSEIDRPRRITIVSRDLPVERRIIVEVHDNGTGFQSGSTAQLFEAFYTTKPQGMGMGLAISRSIVSSLGGQLDARPSDEGEGVCMSVRLNHIGNEETVR